MGAWRDRQGDVWVEAGDGLLHSLETRPFERAHVEAKWGPLIPTVNQPCVGCAVREPWEHRCLGDPCPCEECREERRLFG